MDSIFHDTYDSQIENGDIIIDRKHIHQGELKRFDLVLAIHPFLRTTAPEGMKFRSVQFWMLKKGKADFMFVQAHDIRVQGERTHGCHYASWSSFPGW